MKDLLNLNMEYIPCMQQPEYEYWIYLFSANWPNTKIEYIWIYNWVFVFEYLIFGA